MNAWQRQEWWRKSRRCLEGLGGGGKGVAGGQGLLRTPPSRGDLAVLAVAVGGKAASQNAEE